MPFRRLPGTSRRYVDLDTGETLSRRQVDARRELAGERKRLDAATRANLARARSKYQDLVKTATQRELKRIDAELARVERQIETSDPIGSEQLKQLRRSLSDARRTARKRTRESPEFKRAVKTLKKANASDVKAVEAPKGQLSAKQIQLRDALVRLGKRENVPDWVPPGLSDKYRTGKLRRDRIPKWAYKSSHPPRRTKQQRIKGR